MFEQELENFAFAFTDNVEEAVDLINSTVNAVLICSGSLGEVIIPKIEHLKNLLT